LALSLLQFEPTRCRADPGGARDRRQRREHPRVGPALWSDLRQYAQAATATTRRQVVHGRGVVVRLAADAGEIWRAVDQDGNVLDILVQSRRSATAAKRFFRKQELRRRPARDPAERQAPPKPTPEQSR